MILFGEIRRRGEQLEAADPVIRSTADRETANVLPVRASRWRSIVAGAYAGLGVAALLRPAAIPAVFGGSAPTSESRTEIRVVYAGIPLAFAASLTASGRASESTRSGVVGAVRDATAGMAVARLMSGLVERRLKPWPTGAFVVVEAGLAVALTAANRPTPRT